MYTYDPFETFGTFTLFRPFFLFLLVISFLLLAAVLLPPRFNKFLNLFSVMSISFILVYVSVQLSFYHGIIVDEIGLGGDPVSFSLAAFTMLFCVLAFVIYISKLLKKNANAPQ